MPSHDASPARPWRARRARGKAGAGFLSPAAKRAVDDTGIDVREVTGTGTEGRITRADVRIAVQAKARAVEVVEPFSAIRRTTAVNVARARASVPHAHVAVLCDYGKVDVVRRAQGLTYLPF